MDSFGRGDDVQKGEGAARVILKKNTGLNLHGRDEVAAYSSSSSGSSVTNNTGNMKS